MRCAILAGGLGTRLRSVTGDLPKPMVRLDGVPLLERLIGLCRDSGITRIDLLLGYRPEVIREHFGDGQRFGVDLRYWEEPEPLGTAGAVRQLLPGLTEDLLILSGDVFVDMDLGRLFEFHRKLRPAATLVVHPNDHPFDSDLIELRGERVTAFHSKPHAAGAYFANLVNAGVYIVTTGLLERVPQNRPSDFGRDIFPAALAAGDFLAGYDTPEYIKDIGLPERYREVEEAIRAGVPARCNLSHRRRAIFLDRDGTLIKLVPLLHRVEDVELYPGAAEAVRAINQREHLAVVVTNQPQMARGLVTEEGLTRIHNKIEWLLGEQRAKLDAIYYCPHHPDRGYPEEVPELKIPCRCRKPDTLLYERAAERFHIDLGASAMVGDSARDVEAARRLGCRAVLVGTGLGGSDLPGALRPDFVAPDLLSAVKWITEADL